ncbi:MAG: hypothetical protein MHM6MM_006621, partial [Cercozoa sp. M6MM]
MQEQVAIVDAGSQFGKLIDRRVRELGVKTVLLTFDTPAEQLSQYGAIIVSGGPESVTADGAPALGADTWAALQQTPVLGICYGMQLMVHELGGTVENTGHREDGQHSLKFVAADPLFKGVPADTEVLLTHGDSVTGVPRALTVTAKSENGVIAAVRHLEYQWHGVQFHPEVQLSVHGEVMLRNFVFDVAALSVNFSLESRHVAAVAALSKINQPVLVLCSGGVDSTVCAALLHEALPAEQIKALHVDTGFMRENESDEVAQALRAIGVPLKVVNSETDFLAAVGDGVDPEKKRHAIGDTFMEVAERAIHEFWPELDADNVVLCQGTLRPDLIESANAQLASAKAACIKTHHNDTHLVRVLRAKGRVVEPLQELHKDEVRLLGRSLALPEHLVQRQPFPGPGLAIRLLCATEPYVPSNATEIIDLANQCCRDFGDIARAHLLPVRTVGVQGDSRSYASLVALELTAPVSGVSEIEWPRLLKLARAIPRRVAVNRVVLIMPNEQGVHGDWQRWLTPSTMTPQALRQLQRADSVVNDTLAKHALLRKLSQVPVVSFPCSFGIEEKRSVAIRTFVTTDFMTGRPALPGTDYMPFEALQE